MDDIELKNIFQFYKTFVDIYGNKLVLNEAHLAELHRQYTLNSPDSEATRKGNNLKANENPDHALWKYKKEIENCSKCELSKSRNQFVFGAGNPDADIMFVGEAPGQQEDRTGIPFVGRAGKLLDELLAGIHLQRSDIFIGNILKCRPPQNRDPLSAEITECLPHLHRQIKLIQPKVIICLGRIAAHNLLNITDTLKSMRERMWKYEGVDMVVTYHPAAILRNPNLRSILESDFVRVQKLIQS